MKMHSIFHDRFKLASSDEVFGFLLATFKTQFLKPNHFTDWAKVEREPIQIGMAWHMLDYTLRQDDLEQALFELIKDYPEIVDALSQVFAIGKEREIITIPNDVGDHINSTKYTFDSSNLKTDNEIRKAVDFCKRSGLLDFIKNPGTPHFISFIYGIKAAFSSGERKDYSSEQMESIVEHYIQNICAKHGFKYKKQVNPAVVFNTFDALIELDSERCRFDFAVNTSRGVYLIETSFCDNGECKLKAMEGDYSSLYQLLKKNNHHFVWITDGQGWLNSRDLLRETFDKTDYTLNLEMLNRGILEDIFLKT